MVNKKWGFIGVKTETGLKTRRLVLGSTQAARGFDDGTGANETNRYLNTKSNEGQQATSTAHLGHVRVEREGLADMASRT